MRAYDRITLDLFEKARAETNRRLQEVHDGAPARLQPLIRYVNENIYSAGLTLPYARKATGIRASGFCEALGGVKSFAAYLAEARIETAERMAAANMVPLGCVMNAVGVGSHSSFLRQWAQYARSDLILFEAPDQLEPAFDVVSWHHAVNRTLAPFAPMLAEILFAISPPAFRKSVDPRDVLEGMPLRPTFFRRHRGANAHLDLNEASRRPLRTIAWAATTAGVEYGRLYEYLGQQAFDPERSSMRSLTLGAARTAASVKDSSPSSKLAFLVGETWRPFCEKRLVEAAIGLLAKHSAPAVAAALSLPEEKLSEMFYRRTGTAISDVEATIRQTAEHRAFEPWIMAGQDASRLHEEECCLLISLLEGAVKGSCSGLKSRLPDHAIAVATLLAPVCSDNRSNEDHWKNWALRGALAEALDFTAQDLEIRDAFRRGILQSPLREEIFQLEWFTARLDCAGVDAEKQPQGGYKPALKQWRAASEAIDTLPAPAEQTIPLVWACIHRYKQAPATPVRTRWVDLAESALKSDSRPSFLEYRHSLAGLLKAYRAMDVLVFRPEDLTTVGTLINVANGMVSTNTDPWVITEIKNIAANFYHSIGRREDALRMVGESYDIAKRFQMPEQEAMAILVMAYVQLHYGVPMKDQLRSVLDKKIYLSRRTINLLKLRYIQDQLYFSWKLNTAEITRELAELASAFEHEKPMAAWLEITEGLLLLRLARFQAASAKFSTAKEAFEGCRDPGKKHWAELFLAVSLFAADEPQASIHALKAANYFSSHTHGQVRKCALQCLQEPTAAAIAQLGRVVVCPQAPDEALAQGQTWGAVIRTG